MKDACEYVQKQIEKRVTAPESGSAQKEQKIEDPDQRDYEITKNQIRQSKLDQQLLAELQ